MVAQATAVAAEEEEEEEEEEEAEGVSSAKRFLPMTRVC
jgi:hypothetical protein